MRAVGLFRALPRPDTRAIIPDAPKVSFPIISPDSPNPWDAWPPPWWPPTPPAGWPPTSPNIPSSWWDFAERFMRLAWALAYHRASLGNIPGWPFFDLRNATYFTPGIVNAAIDWLRESWRTHYHTYGAGTLGPYADTRISSSQQSTNYGSSDTLTAGAPSTTSVLATLIKFDTLGIPANAVVTGATLNLYQTVEDIFASTQNLYRVLVEWTEYGATYAKRDGVNAWQTPGCKGAADRASVAMGTRTSPGMEANGWKSWTLDVATVQGWVNGSLPNYGMLLEGPDSDSTRRSYASKEHTTVAWHPYLTIDYLMPSGPAVWLPDPAGGGSLAEFSALPDFAFDTIDDASIKVASAWLAGLEGVVYSHLGTL